MDTMRGAAPAALKNYQVIKPAQAAAYCFLPYLEGTIRMVRKVCVRASFSDPASGPAPLAIRSAAQSFRLAPSLSAIAGRKRPKSAAPVPVE
jgi:hypothetical protein